MRPPRATSTCLNTIAALLSSLLLPACFGGDKDQETGASSCGDLDGSGGETGDLPDITGFWTATFGTRAFYDDCDVAGLSQDDMDWLNGSVIEVKGTPPDNIAADIDDERFYGLENDYGGVSFTGVHEQGGYSLVATFGGLLYNNVHLDHTRIDGGAFIGVDLDGDGSIDCGLRGDFSANRSGS